MKKDQIKKSFDTETSTPDWAGQMNGTARCCISLEHHSVKTTCSIKSAGCHRVFRTLELDLTHREGCIA